MLYTIVGHTDMNTKEALNTLETLEQAEIEKKSEEPMWLVFLAEEGESDTITAIVDWANKRNMYFEVVLEESEDLPELFQQAEEVHKAKRVYDKLFRVTQGRVMEGEGNALLLLDAEVAEHEETTAYLANRCLEEGIPVYDLLHQMTEVTWEDEAPADEAPSEPAPAPQEPEVDEAPSEPTNDEPWATEAELMALSPAELRALVEAHGVTPRDLRKKQSMIEALLGEHRSTDAEQETPNAISIGLEEDMTADEDGRITTEPPPLVKEADPELEALLADDDDAAEDGWIPDDAGEYEARKAAINQAADDAAKAAVETFLEEEKVSGLPAVSQGPDRSQSSYYLTVIQHDGLVRQYPISYRDAEPLIPHI